MKARKHVLKCPVCFAVFDPSHSALTCATCDAPTVVAMNLSGKRLPVCPEQRSMWRYFAMLPLDEKKWISSQGEGWTPLTESPALAEQFGIDKLFLKNETLNPTGSFKDRQISFGISKAREAGANTVAVVSSGNVAAAAASYSAIAGIKCNIFTPYNAPEEKLVQARMYGATFYRVNTLSSSRIFSLVSTTCEQKGWYLLSTAGLYNPYSVEGAKTIAYELLEQSAALPDWIVAPVGGGGLLGALWRGFEELKAIGECERIPSLVGVQSSVCTPLVNAIQKNLDPAHVVKNPVEVGDTIAGAIADDVLFDAYTAIPAVKQTGGAALSVTDDDMLAAERLLARSSGIFAEPASAATIAALGKLRQSGKISRDQTVCCIVTGSGFKDMASARKLVGPPIDVEPSEDTFSKLD